MLHDLAIGLLGIVLGGLATRWWLGEAMKAAEIAATESCDYACRLLESPAFYRSEMETMRAVAASPLYGYYGRLPDTPVESN